MRERVPKHPGPFRVMQVDAEMAGILVAVGFFVMGFVSVPIAKGFLIGAFLVGDWSSRDPVVDPQEEKFGSG